MHVCFVNVSKKLIAEVLCYKIDYYCSTLLVRQLYILFNIDKTECFWYFCQSDVERALAKNIDYTI